MPESFNPKRDIPLPARLLVAYLHWQVSPILGDNPSPTWLIFNLLTFGTMFFGAVFTIMMMGAFFSNDKTGGHNDA